MSDADSQNPLALAQATIAQQEAEIRLLRNRLAEEQFAKDLRASLITAAAANVIASPVASSQLLEMIVQTAAYMLSAQAASLFLIDKRRHDLVFEVALGQKADAVKHFRIPLGHGIAGLVGASGQPMAISNAKDDPRQASDISQVVGYIPESILCVPLLYNDQIIGVLELLDKADGTSFNTMDMNALGLFANLAAVAIEQSRLHEGLVPLIVEVLQSSGEVSELSKEEIQQRAETFVTSVEEGPTYHNAIEFARLVNNISRQGEDELMMCQAVLQAFADYLETRPKSTTQLGWL